MDASEKPDVYRTGTSGWVSLTASPSSPGHAARHHDVGEDQGDLRVALQQCERLARVGCFQGPIAEVSELRHGGPPDLRIVFDDEDELTGGGTHRLSGGPRHGRRWHRLRPRKVQPDDRTVADLAVD